MPDSTPIIHFENARIVNGEVPVIYDFSMSIMPGDFVYIIGKVGTGKTSIIRTMIAENPVLEGKGTVCGFHLETLKTRDIPSLRRSIGVVFQDFQLLMDRTVSENLEFVLKCTGWENPHSMERRIKEVLKSVGMESKAHKMPFQLSGGEQQRIAIARALLNSPALIIADEPTGNLDAATSEDIMNLLRSINAGGTAIVMVTHNNNIVEQYPGRVFVCADEKCEERI